MFDCTICKKEIRDIWVVVSNATYRKDFVTDDSGKIEEIDREYFNGFVESLIYKCNCGETEIRAFRDKVDLSDFLKESNIIDLSEYDYHFTEKTMTKVTR